LTVSIARQAASISHAHNCKPKLRLHLRACPMTSDSKLPVDVDSMDVDDAYGTQQLQL